ncbi:hypothetical protein HBI24_123630 [Parastagonospora nodorum]|nr:hypothetical protein HBH52_008910 [Parastagonospora nodorum]KAH4059621.1 hypothetical protein HBH49_020630 [Parastagonospora nodorum]KAH4312663.1 hypothetical protein HBI01_008580 [Parastagonospora nodorum]KAH4316358.1 hypothetical protein HBI02_046180 [Parastagonospora nodorum]KAH4332612.1 hypothetical protein HBI00_060630 [Parastagonospora nodorum]
MYSVTDRRNGGVEARLLLRDANLQTVHVENCHTARKCPLAREVKVGTKQKKTTTESARCISVSPSRDKAGIPLAPICYSGLYFEVFGEHVLFCIMGIRRQGARFM